MSETCQPVVWIVNKAGHDFSTAEAFGKLRAITTGNINVFRPDRDLYKIQSMLRNFQPETDYLLLSGNVFANAMAVASLRKTVSVIQFLVYDAKHQKYMKHVLSLKSDELIFKRDEKGNV